MRFLFTMNMPSSNGFLVHQIIFEHDVESLDALMVRLNNDVFILGKQFYKRQRDNGESVFVDKGYMILNTSLIGKVQPYIDFDNDFDDRPIQKQRPPVRNRGMY